MTVTCLFHPCLMLKHNNNEHMKLGRYLYVCMYVCMKTLMLFDSLQLCVAHNAAVIVVRRLESELHCTPVPRIQ